MMINCKNCGHESHCGVPLYKEFRREPYNHGIEGQTEVCRNCRCELCEDKVSETTPKAWADSSTTSSFEE